MWGLVKGVYKEGVSNCYYRIVCVENVNMVSFEKGRWLKSDKTHRQHSMV